MLTEPLALVEGEGGDGARRPFQHGTTHNSPSLVLNEIGKQAGRVEICGSTAIVSHAHCVHLSVNLSVIICG